MRTLETNDRFETIIMNYWSQRDSKIMSNDESNPYHNLSPQNIAPGETFYLSDWIKIVPY